MGTVSFRMNENRLELPKSNLEGAHSLLGLLLGGFDPGGARFGAVLYIASTPLQPAWGGFGG